MDSQTTDNTDFAVVSHYNTTIKALETLRSTAKYLWTHNENPRFLWTVPRELENGLFSINSKTNETIEYILVPLDHIF